MRTIKLGMQGDDVTAWQNFLIGQGYDLVASGTFDQDTLDATESLQGTLGLTRDGIVGPNTAGAAHARFGFVDPDAPAPAAPFPQPSWTPMTPQQAAQVFEPFQYKPAGTPSDPEAITILGDWVQRNIVMVTIPELRGITGAPGSCKVAFHRKGAEQLRTMFAAWGRAGLMPLVLSYAGTWAPRFIRGSRTVLSNHAYGTAIDLNAGWNPLGSRPKPEGAKGSLVELLPIAYDHGFKWGGLFGGGRTDGMHLEIGQILDTPAP